MKVKEEKVENKKVKEKTDKKSSACCNNNCDHHDSNKHTDCHCNNNDDLKKELEGLRQSILTLTKEKQELENKAMYAQAELVNYRKRKDEETQNMLKFANQDLITELLVILDNFERAMASMPITDETSKVMEGIQMIYNHFNETLKNFGVTEIEAKDLTFDPTYHEAVMTSADQEKENDTITSVLLKGYMLKDRVIRAAKVVVNKLD